MLSKRGWTGSIWRSCRDAHTRWLSVTQRVGRCLFMMLRGNGIRRAGPQMSVDAPKMWVLDAGFVWELLSVLLFLMRDYSRSVPEQALG